MFWSVNNAPYLLFALFANEKGGKGRGDCPAFPPFLRQRYCEKSIYYFVASLLSKNQKPLAYKDFYGVRISPSPPAKKELLSTR